MREGSDLYRYETGAAAAVWLFAGDWKVSKQNVTVNCCFAVNLLQPSLVIWTALYNLLA